MRYGIWTPLPLTVQPEPRLDAASVQLATHGRAGEPDLLLEFASDVLTRAEGYGFDLSLIAQRFLGNDPDCLMLGAALAARTRTMHLMPAVYPGMITPQVVAKMGATLDRLSGGRFALNVVSGWFKEEFEIFSNGAWLDDEDAKYTRIEEFIAVLKGLWMNDTFSFEGRFYQLQNGRLPNRPAQVPHPPLYSASRTPRGKDIIARDCDIWFVPVQGGIDRYEENFAQVENEVADMTRRAARYGRKLGYAISCHVMCAPSTRAAYERGLALEAYGKENRLAFIAAKGLGAGLVGSPELIAERLQRYEALGVDTLMLHFHPMIEGLDVFGREVMPLMGAHSDSTRTLAVAS